jgi:hypothetical protein
VPDPRIQVADRVQAESVDRPLTTADVQRVVLPYTPDGGSMRLILRDAS